MGEMRILASSGDQKVVWDPNNEDEVDAAEATYDALVEKRFQAYSVKKDGSQNKKLSKFDPKAGAIIMVPPVAGG